jgi:hypothetical protein
LRKCSLLCCSSMSCNLYSPFLFVLPWSHSCTAQGHMCCRGQPRHVTVGANLTLAAGASRAIIVQRPRIIQSSVSSRELQPPAP